jgi:nucleotide-binding universal stress UspA family protein
MDPNDNNKQSDFRVKPLKRVLIALDFDPSARKVAEYGYSLARSMNAQAFLLHVLAEEVYYSSLEYSPITGFSGFSNADFTLMASSEGLTRASQYFLETTKAHLGDDTIEAIVDQGDFQEVILNNASKLGADLIVMGSHSRRWLDHILMGSVTEKVMNNTSIPLLIVPIRDSEK